MNDPHLLGMALGFTGLWLYLRSNGSMRWLCLSAVAFSLSLFTKQSLLAIPAAVVLDLLLASRKRFGMVADAVRDADQLTQRHVGGDVALIAAHGADDTSLVGQVRRLSVRRPQMTAVFRAWQQVGQPGMRPR